MDIRDEVYSRTYGIYGPDMVKLFKSHVMVIGLGGVGGALAISLARCGVGELTLVDGDYVAKSNLNRQMIATISNLGVNKAEAALKMIKDINPDIKVNISTSFFSLENMEKDEVLKNIGKVDYVADAIDNIKAKTELIKYCVDNNIPIISSMGAGNKTNPCGFKVSDISKTQVDPLARVMRQRLRKLGINHFKVVYSEEEPIEAFGRELIEETESKFETTNYTKSRAPSSSPFVPSVAGLLMGSEIVKDLVNTSDT